MATPTTGVRRPPVRAPQKEDFDPIEELGRKGPQFLTMTRADFAAYEYLTRQSEAREWIETILNEKLEEDFWRALADGIILCRLGKFKQIQITLNF